MPPVAPTSWVSSQVPGQPPVPAACPLARADRVERVFSGKSSRPVGSVVQGLAPGCDLCNRRGTICTTWAGPRDPNGALPMKGRRACDACSTAHRICELWQDFADAFEDHRSLARFQFEYWEHLGTGHFAPLEPDPVSSNPQTCPPSSSRNSKPSPKKQKQESPPPRRYRTRSSNPHTAANQTPADGPEPIPPIETVEEASESDDDIPLSEDEEEEDELDSEEGPPDGPTSPYMPVIGPKDFEMDVDSPPPSNPAAQASTFNLEDPRQPLPPHRSSPPLRPPVPPQISFLGIPLESFADESLFAPDMLRYDTLALLQYYDEHPCANQLTAHGYLEGLLGLVGSIMRGEDMELGVVEE
ncbi:hypothetical protein C8J57DRAFT_1510877 [Mycena rebaudengoi]|nr:hypothetical protein C8J57DRAFT_1510877 [Mycena rebaudengoi]